MFIFTHFVFLIFTTLPGVFINTFFFNQDGKISTVAIYTAITLLGLSLVMQISSQISLKKSPTFILRVGVVLYNVFYITLLLLQNNAAKYMVLLGVINAIASGFYWQGYNEILRLCTSESIFDRTVSIIGLAGAVVTLTMPFLSGIIITYCPGTIGYSIVFAVAFLFSLYNTYLTTRLENRKIQGKSNLPAVYRYIFSNKRILAANFVELIRGIRNSAFPLFLNIFFFKLVSNEALLGVNNMLCGFASIISYALAARILRPNNRMKYILASSLISVVVFLPMFFTLNSAIIFVSAIANSFLCAFIDNPALAMFFSLFEEPLDGITFSQIMSAHEVFFAVGRVIGLFLFIVLSQSNLMIAIFVLISNLSIILMWIIEKLFVVQKQNG